jgi:methionine biosynthesis protein MetW
MYEFKPFKYSSHEKIISLVKPNSKVLDIGCASGYIASQLKLKNCEVTGIDNDEKSLEEAKKHCNKVFLLDISKESVDGKFDFIILGDIIEHTSNPEEVLIKLKKNLNQNGKMIVSVPNIVNIYARLRIIFGTFPQEDKGIFDRTHLKFFTIKTLRKIIKDNNFKLKKLNFTPIPFKLIFPHSPTIISDLLSFLAYLWPNLFAYQLIATIANAKPQLNL